jgi:hypothetical protein
MFEEEVIQHLKSVVVDVDILLELSFMVCL